MKKNSLITFLFCSLFTVFSVSAQETGQKSTSNNKELTGVKDPQGVVRCLTVESNEKLRQNGLVETKEDFEKWLAPKLEAAKARRANGLDGNGTVITIPVVVHVIHNGDPINSNGDPNNENISYAQAASQIDVLNEDFRRLEGSPGAIVNRYGLGVDVEIQFCLAQQDPNGNATDGVNRVDMGQSGWSEPQIQSVVKPSTIWDPTKYMNMWSVKFSGNDILGYAQFPSSSTLGGISAYGGAANTDGVVSNYNVFGTIFQNDGSFVLDSFYNQGRTMTHEVGHWLGLRHIWGDSAGCGDGANDGDFVADTPASSGPNYYCQTVYSCTTSDMVENYMDYTNDACMNTFTQGQKDRILVVMANSPRRVQLMNSIGCNPVGDGMSINEEEFKKGISLYPNPSSSLVNITVENNGLPTRIKVYNTLGQLMSESKVQSSADLTQDVSSYSNGVYFIKVEKDNNSVVLRFVKQ